MIDPERTNSLFRKLEQVLSKAAAQPLPERVHQVRTTARRLEAALDALYAEPDRRQKRLRRGLKRLRRSAGAVRDFDVQIAALRKLKIGRETERKARLMQALNEMRAEHEQEYTRLLESGKTRKLRKRLARAERELAAASRIRTVADGRPAGEAWPDLDPVATSLRMFARLARQVHGFTAENLHAYRTQCKRIRYVAEMAGNDASAKPIVEQLKRIQDATGDWRDWVMLAKTAESLFARSMDSALVAALHNVSNAKFVEARGVATDARRHLLAQYRAMLARRPRQPAPGPTDGTRARRPARKTKPDATAAAPPRKPRPASVRTPRASVA